MFFDACTLINLKNSGLLVESLRYTERRNRVGPIVLGECDTQTVGLVYRAQEANLIEFVHEGDMPATQFLLMQSEHAIGAGETEAIVLARQHDAHLCCDDGKARRVGRQLLDEVRVTGSIGLLLRVVRANACSPTDAFDAYRAMVDAGGFLPTFDLAFFEPH